jgi:hypothetical protein
MELVSACALCVRVCVLRCARYFGAAKQLPGVKELFEKEAPQQVCGGTPDVLCVLFVPGAGDQSSAALAGSVGDLHLSRYPEKLGCSISLSS